MIMELEIDLDDDVLEDELTESDDSYDSSFVDEDRYDDDTDVIMI